MPRQNAGKGADPMVSVNNSDRAHSPDASREEAMVDIPLAPATIADMKRLDPYCTIGSAGDLVGMLDEAVREGDRQVNSPDY